MLRKDDDPEREQKSNYTLQSSRFFKLYNYWYFATREGATLGPFDTREQAAVATEDYIGFVEDAPLAAIEMLQRHAHPNLNLH